jgi:cobalt-zinc-cadmium efflux system outer membrane protein
VAARYNREILPRAQKAYEMYLSKFRQMAAAYPQALIAQRTLFQAQTEYVTALVDLWQNVVQLRGMLLMGGLDAPSVTRGADSGAMAPLTNE